MGITKATIFNFGNHPPHQKINPPGSHVKIGSKAAQTHQSFRPWFRSRHPLSAKMAHSVGQNNALLWESDGEISREKSRVFTSPWKIWGWPFFQLLATPPYPFPYLLERGKEELEQETLQESVIALSACQLQCQFSFHNPLYILVIFCFHVWGEVTSEAFFSLPMLPVFSKFIPFPCVRGINRMESRNKFYFGTKSPVSINVFVHTTDQGSISLWLTPWINGINCWKKLNPRNSFWILPAFCILIERSFLLL